MFTFAIFPGIQSFNNVGDNSQETASINSGDCGYRLIKNTKIVKTMFLAEPATIDEILLQAGEKNHYHLELTRVFPCGSVIDLTDGRISLVGRLSGAQILACGKRIDLNEAGETDLASVPGIGETLARKIVEYRNSVGGFSSPFGNFQNQRDRSSKSAEFSSLFQVVCSNDDWAIGAVEIS